MCFLTPDVVLTGQFINPRETVDYPMLRYFVAIVGMAAVGWLVWRLVQAQDKRSGDSSK